MAGLDLWRWPALAGKTAGGPPVLSGNSFDLVVEQTPVNLTGRPSVATAVNGLLPGPILRWREGDRAAMEDVRTRGGADGRQEVPYDGKNAKQDARADVLIQYLVRPGYAEVRTDEPEPGHYVYYIRIDWPRLRSLVS